MEYMNNLNFEEEKKTVLKYRWIIYIILALVYFLSNFHKYSTGVMKNELTDSFHLSTVAFGNLSSMVFYSYLLMQIPTGILVDTIGPRKTVTAGSIVTAVGSFMFAWAQTLMLANISRFIIGMGISVTYISLLKVQTKWFRTKEFATMTGLTFLIGNFGSVMAQTPLRILVDVFSWRGIYFIFGIVSIIMGILVYIFVRNSPNNMGLVSIEEIDGKTGEAETTKEEEKFNILKTMIEVIKNKYNIPIFAIGGCIGVAASILNGSFGTAYISDTYNVSMVEASKNTMLLTLGMAFGSAIIGIFSDLIKRRKNILIILTCGMNIVWIYIVVICKGEPNFNMLGLLYLLSGVFMSACLLPYTMAKESNNPLYAGMSVSFVGLFDFLGSSIGPVMTGKILDINSINLTGGELYAKAFMFLVICNTIAFIGSLFVKETRCENIYEIAYNNLPEVNGGISKSL